MAAAIIEYLPARKKVRATVVPPANRSAAADFTAFSLQDAIDYAKFLIRTTADYQRFSGSMPTVGGDIDIALVTNHRGFRWIAQKQLYNMLDRESEGGA